MKKHRTIIQFATLFIMTAFLILSCEKEVQPPEAKFTYSPQDAEKNESITFDAGESTPGTCDNCEIIKYYWDWDNDGVWDQVTESSTSTHRFSSEDVYTVALKVRNNQGYTNVENATQEVAIGEAGSTPSTDISLNSPENGASDISVTPTLSWSASDPEGKLRYDIYLGTSSSPNRVQTNHESTSYESSKLDENATYFWKIVAKDGEGGETESDAWAFTTEGTGPGVNRAPNRPTSPYPESGAQDRPLNQILKWEASDPDGDELTFDLYIGGYQEEPSNKPPLAETGITSTSYNPRQAIDLQPNATYYWMVIAQEKNTEDNYRSDSVLWHFTTGNNDTTCTEEITYNNQTYQTQKIGTQCWMAENLNTGEKLDVDEQPSDNNTDEKYCYNTNETNCGDFGGLYTWDEMMNYSENAENQGICPDGWHLPSEDEWQILVDHLGGSLVAGKKLKKGGSSGFDALMSGTKDSNGDFKDLDHEGYYWSSTSNDNGEALQIHLNKELNGVFYNFKDKDRANAVRCIKD